MSFARIHLNVSICGMNTSARKSIQFNYMYTHFEFIHTKSNNTIFMKLEINLSFWSKTKQ